MRVTETTSEIEAREDILVELRNIIKVSQESRAGATHVSASAGALDGEADSVFEDESVDRASNIDALTRAIAALEKGVATSSFLKSAVMKFGPDAGENPFVDLVRGCPKNSDHPGKDSPTRERARVTPVGQPGKSEMETGKAGSSEFERSHREKQATTKPIEMRAGKTHLLESELRERRWGWGKTPRYVFDEGRKVAWEELEKMVEDRWVEVVPMMKGGGKKRKARNAGESSNHRRIKMIPGRVR